MVKEHEVNERWLSAWSPEWRVAPRRPVCRDDDHMGEEVGPSSRVKDDDIDSTPCLGRVQTNSRDMFVSGVEMITRIGAAMQYILWSPENGRCPSQPMKSNIKVTAVVAKTSD